MRRPTRCAVLAAFLLLTGSTALLAQGENAFPLAKGTLRVGLEPDWSRWDQRFGSGTPGYANGAREPLAVDFSSDSLGVTQLPFLADAQSRVRAATGVGAFQFNLGRAQLTLNNSVKVIPFSAAYGVSRRFGVRAMLPIVRARVDAYLLGPDSTTNGNVGLNPALASPGALNAFRSQVDSALVALQEQAASGPAALRGQAQAAYASLQPFLCAPYTLGEGNAGTSASPCFVAGRAFASPVLPVSGSEAGDSIVNRLTNGEANYDALRTAYAADGVALPPLDQTYTLPATALDSAQLRDVFSAPGGAVAGDSLTSLVRTRLGNLELGGWYQLAMSARWRSQVAFTLRLPTGVEDNPDNAIDLGTGYHAMGWEVGWRNDVVLRPDFWFHAGASAAGWATTSLVRRVMPADVLIAPLADTATVRRSPGAVLSVDLVPNWQLDDAFSLGLGVHWTHQAATRYAYVNPADSARTGYAAGVLDAETQATALSLGAGVTFATVDRYARGQASVPYRLTVAYRKAFAGSGGKVPAYSAFSLSLQIYIAH